MDRLACIDLPAFPLQLLLRREPGWAGRPVAVVEEDKPLARILWLNEEARRAGILPGMRYAAGLSLSTALCAAPVPPATIEAEVLALVERLGRLSPGVEPAPGEPGLFWVAAAGLHRLHRSASAWARALHATLCDAGFSARVAVGFRRFLVHAAVRAHDAPDVAVFATAAEEEARARAVRLSRLALTPALRDRLADLGVATVDDLLRLPAGGLRERLGEEAFRLGEGARGEAALPLQPAPPAAPLRRTLLLDHPERDAGRLLFSIKRELHPLLAALVARREALLELTLALRLEDGGGREERLRPADPTVDLRLLLELVLLRLEATRLRAGVVELSLDAAGVPASREQLLLFAERPRRDPKAARRALARLRAELGDDAVVFARLRDGHLPEAGFAWEPGGEPAAAAPRPVLRRPLVRRLLARPLPLPRRRRHEEDGWQLRGGGDAPVDELRGPYLVSGGWWRREVRRAYHFARTRKEEWLWIYHDRDRRRWFLQGRVE